MRLTHAAVLPTSLADAITRAPDAAALVGACREALAHGRNVLVEHHLQGGGAAATVKHHAKLIDRVLQLGWRQLSQNGEQARAALVAVGGYGRGELNMESDVDLLILLPAEKSADAINADAEKFIRLCWDMGLKVGHGARRIEECIEIAREDITVITNLMEARAIAGDAKLFEKFRKRLHTAKLWPAARYFKDKLAEQTARHRRFHDTAYNLEPNIKEGAGGLRDLHMIGWVANRYFGTSDLTALMRREFLTRNELKALINGRNFLWQLRNALHILAGRCEDRLLFNYQIEIAEQLGYRKNRANLAVEQMMQKYYRTLKELQLLNELLLHHFSEAILSRGKLREKKINARFVSVGDFVATANKNVFRKHPAAMLELFHILQLNPHLKGVRAATIRQLRDNLGAIDEKFRRNPKHCKLFLTMFKHQEGLTHALRRMNAYGVLGGFFPAFGKIIGQMQHDLFHVYTVDAHSLFVVRNLRHLANAPHEMPMLSALFGRQNRRERLLLAAFCHDIGKGSGRDHSIVGEQIARKLCARLGMSEYDAAFVAWLVREHLTMSRTAQHEDTSDPRVVDRFAQVVGDQERLDNLYLLTCADIRGTNPKFWNEWRGELLHSLYVAASRRLRSGIGGEQSVRERINERKTAITELAPAHVPPQQLEQLWELLDDEYFLRNGPETAVWHAEQICRANLIDAPLTAARHRAEIKAQQILVVAPEAEDLLLRVTGGLDKLNLNILDAHIHQTKSGMALLTFIAADPDANGANAAWLEENVAALREFLLTDSGDYAPGKRILPRQLKQFRVPTEVTFGAPNDLNHTPMEVVARDRPGLLYDVACALCACKVKLISAKVSTVGEKAEDTFLITDRDGDPVASPLLREQLETRIKARLAA